MSTSKATARPWVLGSNGAIMGSDGSAIGVVATDANAALIVRAVNSHEALVAALRGLLQHAGCNDYCESERSDAPCDCGYESASDKARAALALAEQGD